MVEYLFIVVLAAALGAAIGSFANVCIYRLPRHLSVSYPPSACPHCQVGIKWYDNIPVLSYLLLGARCRNCHAPISLRYPLVEICVSVLFGVIFFFEGNYLVAVWQAGLITALFIATLIDLEHQIIPDRLNLFILVWGALFLYPFYGAQWSYWLDHCGGLLLGGGMLWLVAFATKGKGMGGGDIKLLGALGLNLGLLNTLVAAFVGFTSGAVVGSVLWLACRRNGKSQLPFGPYLAFGAVVALLWGPQVVAWYLNYAFNS